MEFLNLYNAERPRAVSQEELAKIELMERLLHHIPQWELFHVE